MTITEIIILLLIIGASFIAGLWAGIERKSKSILNELDGMALPRVKELEYNDVVRLTLQEPRRQRFINKYKDKILYYRKLSLQQGVPADQLVFLIDKSDWQEARELGIDMMFGVELRPTPPMHKEKPKDCPYCKGEQFVPTDEEGDVPCSECNTPPDTNTTPTHASTQLDNR